MSKNFGKCVNKKVHWTLETYVHYEMPFEKHFNSFQKYLARILQNLQIWFYNSHPATTFDFLIFWKKREKIWHLKFEIWATNLDMAYGKQTIFFWIMERCPQFGNVITEKRGVSNFELQWNTVLKIVNQFGNTITEKKRSI